MRLYKVQIRIIADFKKKKQKNIIYLNCNSIKWGLSAQNKKIIKSAILCFTDISCSYCITNTGLSITNFPCFLVFYSIYFRITSIYSLITKEPNALSLRIFLWKNNFEPHTLNTNLSNVLKNQGQKNIKTQWQSQWIIYIHTFTHIYIYNKYMYVDLYMYIYYFK